MTKKLTPAEKRARKPAARACTFCHEKHLQCSNERPCRNCVKRNIGDQCQDVTRKRARYLTKKKSSTDPNNNNINNNNINTTTSQDASITDSTPILSPRLIEPINPISMDSGIISRSQFDGNLTHDVINDFSFPNTSNSINHSNNNNTTTNNNMHNNHHTHNNHMLNTTKDVMNRLLFDRHHEDPSLVSRSQPINFTSNYLNQEYLMLGDILKSKPSSPSLSNTSVDQQDLLQNLDFNMFSNKVLQKMKDSRPFISLGYDNSITNPSITNLDNNKNNNNSNNNTNNNNSNNTNNNTSTNDNNNNNNNSDNLDNIDENSFKKAPPLITDLQNIERISRENSSSNLKQIETKVEYVSPLMTHNIYQSVHDIYNNRQMNFDYPQSYHSLTKFLKARFSGNNLPAEEKALKRNNLLIILKLIASYRPTFISAHKNLLKPLDLQFLEMTFQRSLIDYEKLCQLNSCPTIMWRRTGEIVSITDDLLSLLGYNMGDLLSKRTFIMELMYDDESIIKYFKNFKFIAVGNLLSSVQTNCKLKRNNVKSSSNVTNQLYGAQNQNNECIDFRSVWTVKRDIFDMPMLIIGQFLPVLPQSEGMRMY